MIIEKVEVENFLSKVRDCIFTSFEFRSNEKNRNTLIELGLNKRNVRNIICELNVSNYSEGPNDEHNTLNKIWIFGTRIKGFEVYIKIKILGVNNLADQIDTVYCMSFHIAERCLDYPYDDN